MCRATALRLQNGQHTVLMGVPSRRGPIRLGGVAAIGNGAGFEHGVILRLVGTDTETRVYWGPHHLGKYMQGRQQIREYSISAGRTRCSRAAAKDGTPLPAVARALVAVDLSGPANLFGLCDYIPPCPI
jgi:hypothetical protein